MDAGLLRQHLGDVCMTRPQAFMESRVPALEREWLGVDGAKVECTPTHLTGECGGGVVGQKCLHRRYRSNLTRDVQGRMP